MPNILRSLREQQCLTRAQLGYRAEVHPARIGQLELGRLVPRADSIELQRLADALDWAGDPADLLAAVEDDHE